MNSERHHSVWDALGEPPGEVENLRIRAMLMAALSAHIKASGMTQAQAAERLGVTQPRISDLSRGKIDLFSIDTLVNMATAAGLRLDLHVSAAP